MDDERELSELLAVVDRPTSAPGRFKAQLLVELRDAMTAPAPPDTGGPSTEGEVISLDPLQPRPGRRASRAGFALLTAAAVLAAVFVFVAQRSDTTRTAAQPTVTVPAPVRQVSFATACADLLEATTPFSEMVAILDLSEPTRPPSLVIEQLSQWSDELERFDARTADAARDADLEDAMGPTRVRIRQAEENLDRQTLVAIDREWRTATGEGSALESCGT